MRRAIFSAVVFTVATIASASADVVISTHATRQMDCYGNACVPTAKNAVLNATDLEQMCNVRSLTVSTTNGSIQAKNIDITAPFTCRSAGSSLTLEAQDSITFLAVVQNLANYIYLIGEVNFFGKGRLDTRHLVINNAVYKVTSLRGLIKFMNAEPGGFFALGKDSDAGILGVLNAPPISVPFQGRFNGLGHTISNLQIVDHSDSFVGFFATTTHAFIQSVSLVGATISARKSAGALVGQLEGVVTNSFSSGTISGALGGGLVAENDGTIDTSQSTASVNGTKGAGGLAGLNNKTIDTSFATGNVSGAALLGGLVSKNTGTITNAYALGSVGGQGANDVGGFAGYVDEGSISTSYSTGAVSGAPYIGGFQGGSNTSTAPLDCYWDTDTSGTDQGSGDGNETGLTGLTTAQFQSGLPAGFDPKIWAENANINNGFPYLIANPPAQ